MQNIDLYFKEGSSDKEYHAQIEKSGSGYVVNFQYGRVGNALQSGTKTPSPVSLAEAEKIYTKLVKEKMGKGYAEKAGGSTKTSSASASASTSGFSGPAVTVKQTFNIFPQLLNPVEDPEEYITNDAWLAQEKYDGERRMIVSDKDIKGLNRKGQQVQLPDNISTSIKKEMILDGEIIGDIEYVFDILSLEGEDLTGLPCIERIAVLNSNLKLGKGIIVVETAYTTEEKRAMYHRVKNAKGEGVVFKMKNSPYVAGRPNSLGSQIKFKFYKTATFIVKNMTAGKRSVGLELLEGNVRVFMGKVTIPPNKNIPNIGDLVEVRYLYAYKGGAIFQPTYIGVRTDLDLDAANMSQIIYKAGTPEEEEA